MKKNKKKMEAKMVYLGLWVGILKNYCHICNQSPPIVLFATFRRKTRILQFGTKNALLGWFGQEFWKTMVTFVISVFEFAILQSLAQKIRIFKFEAKNARFAYFGAGI